MKKNIIFAAIAALVMTSCIGDLDQAPMSNTTIPGGSVYSNPTYRMGALAKIYGAFTFVGQSGPGSADIAVDDAGASEFLRALWSIQTLSTDEGKCIWGDGWVTEVCRNTWTDTKNTAIYAAYTRAMMMISFANDFLRNTNDESDEIAIERAEVRFLRAYADWVRLDCFGNPPFVDENSPVGAYKPEQIAAADLYEWIKGELKDITAEDSALKAPHTQVYPRVDKGAAYALLTRLCLNHKSYLGAEDMAEYTAAMDAADEVIAAYELAPDYAELFMGDNGENANTRKEIIYASCYDSSLTNSYGGTTYLIAACKNDNTYLGTTEAWAGLVTSTHFAAQLIGQAAADGAKTGAEPSFTSIDKRALVTLKYSKDKDLDGKSFDKGWHVCKFNNNPSTGALEVLPTFSSVDFPMIRLAEIYLAYAEAKARIDGGTTSDTKAVGYVKALQQRAGVSTTITSVNLDTIFEEITKELYWEGLRRTTLVRYNRYSTDSFLWPLKGGVSQGQAFESFKNVFPIPSDDLLVNENLDQNTGYSNK